MGHRDLTTGDRTVTTLCRMCEQGCGMEVTLGPDGPIRVRGDKGHPYSRGWLCIKGLSALDFFSSPRRLSTPLIRGEDGLHRQASWEEALSVTARELHRIRETYGPQSLAIYHGEGVGHQEIKSYMKRFANVYGTPNFMGVGSLCNAARTMADTLTLGQVTRPDIPNTRFLMVWGGNPLVSNEPTTPLEMHRLARRTAALAVVDPRRTPTAGLADYHLAVRPGKDGVLAANLLHVILRQGLWDRPFTNNWINGFSALEGAADDRFSPEAGEARNRRACGPGPPGRRGLCLDQTGLSADRQRSGTSRTGNRHHAPAGRFEGPNRQSGRTGRRPFYLRAQAPGYYGSPPSVTDPAPRFGHLSPVLPPEAGGPCTGRTGRDPGRPAVPDPRHDYRRRQPIPGVAEQPEGSSGPRKTGIPAGHRRGRFAGYPHCPGHPARLHLPGTGRAPGAPVPQSANRTAAEKGARTGVRTSGPDNLDPAGPGHGLRRTLPMDRSPGRS